MWNIKVFILEGNCAVDVLPTITSIINNVSALHHELLDNPVESKALVVQRFVIPSVTHVSNGEMLEVVGCLRHDIAEEANVNSSNWFISDLEI